MCPSSSGSVAPAPPHGEVVVDALAAHSAAFPTDDLVFVNERGQPIRRSQFGHLWRAAVVAAAAPKGTGFHDLRHYYASLPIRHGESVKVVQARLGHATAAETLDTYVSCGRTATTVRGLRSTACSARPRVPSLCPRGGVGHVRAGESAGADEPACKPDSVVPQTRHRRSSL